MASRRARLNSGGREDENASSPSSQLTRRTRAEPDTDLPRTNTHANTHSPSAGSDTSGGASSSAPSNGHSTHKGSSVPKPAPDASPISARAEVSRLRHNTGIADILPPRPEVLTRQIPAVELPAHAVRDSMLHQGSGFDNYRGLYNLALLGLVIVACQISIVNIMKYGILVNFEALLSVFDTTPSRGWPSLSTESLSQYPCMASLLSIQFNILAGWAIERLAAARYLFPQLATGLHIVNVLLELGVPTFLILKYHPHPALSFFTMFTVAVVFMKIVSYAHVNTHYRRKMLADKKKAAAPGSARVQSSLYPSNLKLTDLYYFFLVPTLCYELEFPRNARIRKTFLLRRALECVLFTTLLISLGQQWVQPTVLNTFQRKQGEDEPPLIYLIQRTLKLALPNGFLWLCGFYVFFHSYLNFVGELLQFGDRQFYRDWWNATTLTYFWKNWNIPVHKWAVRHLYRPLIDMGCSKLSSNVVVFLFSAIFHELLVSVPLGMFKYWAFAGMLAQVPLAIITEKYFKGSQYGNVIVWASLMLGQPLAIMLYVNAYFAKIEVDSSTASSF